MTEKCFSPNLVISSCAIILYYIVGSIHLFNHPSFDCFIYSICFTSHMADLFHSASLCVVCYFSTVSFGCFTLWPLAVDSSTLESLTKVSYQLFSVSHFSLFFRACSQTGTGKQADIRATETSLTLSSGTVFNLKHNSAVLVCLHRSSRGMLPKVCWFIFSAESKFVTSKQSQTLHVKFSIHFTVLKRNLFFSLCFGFSLRQRNSHLKKKKENSLVFFICSINDFNQVFLLFPCLMNILFSLSPLLISPCYTCHYSPFSPPNPCFGSPPCL